MSNRKYFPLFLILTAVMVLNACQSTENPKGTEPVREIEENPDPTVVVSGPFRAMATSGFSVDLSWDPVEGATGYQIEISFDDSIWFLIAVVDAGATSYEDFLMTSNLVLNYRLTPLIGNQQGKALDLTITPAEKVPNPFSVVAVREEPDYSSISLEIPGFDPSTFDPSTFDPSTLDSSGVDRENIDPSDLAPEPVSAVARIGPEGGSVSVTGSNGVIYTLDIPQNALDFSTYFVLTPIADIQSYPFSGGYLGAVDIQPQGIIFDTPVILTFDFPEDLIASRLIDPELVQVAFAYEGEGDEFHLTPFAPEGVNVLGAVSERAKMASPVTGNNSKMIIIKQNSNPTGIGNGKPSEIKSHAANQAPINSGANSSQMAALAQMLDELRNDDLKQAQEMLERPGRRAAEIYQSLKSATNLAFLTHSILILQDFFYTPDFGKLSIEEKDGLLNTAAILLRNWLEPVECPSSESGIIQAWVRRLRSPVSEFDKALKTHMQKIYPIELDPWLRAIESVRGCKVQLRLASTVISGDAQAKCRFKMDVSVIVPLSWKLNGDSPILQGGPPQGQFNIIYEPEFEILSQKSAEGWCSKVKFEGLEKSEFVVLELVPKFDAGVQTQKDWILKEYRMAGTVVKLTVTTSYPPPEPDHVGSGLIPENGDPWGGAMTLIRTQGKESPSALGASNWRISKLIDSNILAIWEGNGFYTDTANYHQHKTSLWIEIQ